MAWDDAAPVNEILLYCEVWRSRQDIKDHFKLSAVESWHAVSYIGKLQGVQVEHRLGKTNRAHMFKTRTFAILEIRKNRRMKEEAKAEA